MSKPKPFFSIITPTYNRAASVVVACQSVLEQSFTDWEYIIVDDGSVDDTAEKLQPIVAADDRIRYIWQENAERSVARNRGIEQARGRYILFLDSDDSFLPNNLEELKSKIEAISNPIALLYYDCIKVEDNKQERTVLPAMEQLSVIEYLLAYPLSPLRVCVASEILDQYRFDDDISVVEDVCLWMRIAEKYPIIPIDHIGGKYIIHGANSVSPYDKGALIQYRHLQTFFKRYPTVKSAISREVFTHSMSRICTNIATYFFYNNNRFACMRWTLRALVYKPIGEHTVYRFNIILACLGLRKAPFLS